MKIPLLFSIFILISCYHHSEPKELVLREIRSYMKSHLNDYSSYEMVNTRLDSVFFEEPHNDTSFVGWYVYHTYRAKNGLGAFMLYNYRFSINRDFHITEVKDMANIETWDFLK